MARLDWTAVAALIDGCGPAHLATASASGEPHVAVVATAREDGTIWIAAHRASAKVANLRGNPKAAVVWQGNAAETYLWGRAEVVDAPATKSRLWASGMFPYDMAGFFGSADSPDWVLIEITPQRVAAMVQSASGLERRTWSSGQPAS